MKIKYREESVESRLNTKIKLMGGWSIKLLPTFIRGIPDRMCLLPGGRVFFVETKATGKTPRKSQLLIHKRLINLGFKVYVIDDYEYMDGVLNEWKI